MMNSDSNGYAAGKIEWEHVLVEQPFCRQLEKMGWAWLAGDTDVPELTERASFREVLLKERLVKALRKINLGPDGQTWLDDERIERAIRQMEPTAALRLLEANRQATELLLKGTVTDGLPTWDAGRQQPLRYIDFNHPENNDFLVIDQFKVQLTSGQGHIVPDAVLFVNGIPLAVAEFKSLGIEAPIAQAINQLLRYTNQRKEIYPEQYGEDEGAERLFHTNQLLIASNFFEARAATVGAPPEAYLEWADTSPVPMSLVADEVGLMPRAPEIAEAEEAASAALRALGPEQAERAGTPLFYRQGAAASPPLLSSQQILVAGVLRPKHFLDVMRNFTLFQSAEGKTRKVVARYQQFRAVHRAVERLEQGRSRAAGAERDERGGIVWHTQGSGKSLTMVFLVRKMRTLPSLKKFKIVVVTDRNDLEKQLRETAALVGETVRPSETDRLRRESASARTQRILAEDSPDIVFAMLQKYQDQEAKRPGENGRDKVQMTIARKEVRVVERGEDEAPERVEEIKQVTFEESIQFEKFPELNRSEDILVLVDEAHRSHTRTLHRNLHKALPYAAIIGFTGTPILSKEKTETREIFGDYIDRYLLQDAELDGATVPILYEGRTADGLVKDASSLDQVFEDMFRGYTNTELAIIKARYATQGDVLEAPLLIEKKAADMLRHYVGVVLPEGYKGQVVATSRNAAVIYHEKLTAAKTALVAQLEALPQAVRGLPDDEQAKLDAAMRFLIAAHANLDLIRALEFAVVVSGNHNDPASWKQWTDKSRQEEIVGCFKRRLAPVKSEKADPLGVLIVTNMLLTGFDAPVEQVMYLDRRVIAHDLLQAIARVNRTYRRKPRGYVVDYIGVARHLNEALGGYDKADIKGVGLDINTELPKLRDRHARVMAVFSDRGIPDLLGGVQAAVDLLADLKIRANFINKLRSFYETLSILEHRPEVPPEVFRDAKLLGFINKVAANLYRDSTLNLLGVPERVRALIDRHVAARGVDPKIPPITITDADFEKVVAKHKSPRARAAEMQHAARYHIVGFELQNPAYAKKMSEKLEEILKSFKENWEALEQALKEFIKELKRGDHNDFPGLDSRIQVPFVRLVLEVAWKNAACDATREQQLVGMTVDLVDHIRQEIGRVGFWKSDYARDMLTKHLVRELMIAGGFQPQAARELAYQLVALAKHNHVVLAG